MKDPSHCFRLALRCELAVAAAMVAGLAVLPPAAAQTGFPSSRDPVEWPFATESPWNTPLARTAEYSSRADACTLDLTDPMLFVGISSRFWSQPIYVAKSTDPFTKLSLDASLGLRAGLDPAIHHNNPVSGMKIPANAIPALPRYEDESNTDAHLDVIDETHTYVVEMWRAKWRGPNELSAFTIVRNELKGPGFGTGGARAFGGSAIGGLIRRGELASGIHHAISFCIPRSKQKCCDPAWPATTVDGRAQGSYRGNIPMGQLIAIPPDVDLNNLKSIHLSPQGLSIAKALQDYGAYDVDSGGGLVFYVEPWAASEIGQAEEDLKKLQPFLRCVTNNRPGNVGGGGPDAPRRAPWAPPLK
jgi:hypothetical protein